MTYKIYLGLETEGAPENDDRTWDVVAVFHDQPTAERWYRERSLMRKLVSRTEPLRPGDAGYDIENDDIQASMTFCGGSVP